MHNGITVIIVLLVPALFQIFWQGIRNQRRHQELMRRLDELESRLVSR